MKALFTIWMALSVLTNLLIGGYVWAIYLYQW